MPKIHFGGRKEIISPEGKSLSMDTFMEKICRGAVVSLGFSVKYFLFWPKRVFLVVWWGVEDVANSEIRLSVYHRHLCYGE